MTDQRNSTTPIDPVKLDRLAEVAVKVGLGLRPGQDLLLTAPAIALPLVRRIAVHAYKAGAGIVTPILSDEEMTLARYRHGYDSSFDRAANWLYEGMAKAFSDNTARLAIVGDNPMLLSGEDPSKVARASKANSMAYQPALEKIVNFDTNWNIIAYPSPSWAKQVFPDDPEDVAIGKLADAIFAASRGAEVLNKVLDTDEGARRLGEVALVPHSSPISQSGLLFYNTLFDENAASHIALGQCYSKCFVNGAQLTPQQIAAQGGNQSLIHIDWMIGSAETDIDGILADGSKE